MTTNNLMYDKKIGLFLGDSILRNYLDANENIYFKLKQTFDTDTIETYYKGGANLGHLATEVFPRLMAEIVNSSDNDVCVDVFISAGAIDISDNHYWPRTVFFDIEFAMEQVLSEDPPVHHRDVDPIISNFQDKDSKTVKRKKWRTIQSAEWSKAKLV